MGVLLWSRKKADFAASFYHAQFVAKCWVICFWICSFYCGVRGGFLRKRLVSVMNPLVLIPLALDCGVRGIRTPETLLTFTRFPGVPLQPLEHHSGWLLLLRSFCQICSKKRTKLRPSAQKRCEVNAFIWINIVFTPVLWLFFSNFALVKPQRNRKMWS